jgi:energy-coupling factor transporter ATPase
MYDCFYLPVCREGEKTARKVFFYMISIQKLIHDYFRQDEDGNVAEKVRAVDGVDLEVHAGEFIVILGHNGCGKSTLAKHINALLYPTEGEVWVDGMNTAKEENIWDVRQKAGMIFQNPDNQIIAQVVEEDVGFGPENMGIPTEKIWERVEESLKTVGMYEFRKKSPNRLSGGQKQRVCIAGVMAMHPKCIIMDEPTAMLDPSGRREVVAAARDLNKKEGITIILITHYMEEAIDADRVFVMDHGKVVMQGTPREIFSRVEDMQELHLDVPQVTLLAHELRKNGVRIPAGILTKEELADALIKRGAEQKGRDRSVVTHH